MSWCCLGRENKFVHNIVNMGESMKLCFVDLETTGVDPKVNGVVQISGVVLANGREEGFDWECRPFEGDKVDAEALRVNGVTAEALAGREDPKVVHLKLLSLLARHCDKYAKKDKMWFVGYNANFDYQFLREWFLRCGDKYFGSWFFHPPLDVMTLAGVEVDTECLHNAVYDIGLTRKVWEKLYDPGQP